MTEVIPTAVGRDRNLLALVQGIKNQRNTRNLFRGRDLGADPTRKSTKSRGKAEDAPRVLVHLPKHISTFCFVFSLEIGIILKMYVVLY